MIKYNNPDEIMLNRRHVHSETAIHDDIQYQIELLNDLARSDIDKAFSFALLKN
jgi:hypothetical protein